jgi:hypothetical protein
MNNVIAWDIETIADITGFAAANGHNGKTDDEIRAAMGLTCARIFGPSIS